MDIDSNALEKRTEKNRIERLVVAGQPAGLGIRGQGTKGCLLFLSKRNPPAPKCSSDAALIAQSRFFGPRSSALIYVDSMCVASVGDPLAFAFAYSFSFSFSFSSLLPSLFINDYIPLYSLNL